MAASTTQPRLTLHQLLGSLSLWGSSTRLLLIGFIVAVIFALKLLYLDTSLDWELKVVIYIIGSFALLDTGYIILVRATPLKRRLDQLGLLGAEIVLAAAYVLPNLAHIPSLGKLANWTVLIVLLVLAVRALLGLLFSAKK